MGAVVGQVVQAGGPFRVAGADEADSGCGGLGDAAVGGQVGELAVPAVACWGDEVADDGVGGGGQGCASAGASDEFGGVHGREQGGQHQVTGGNQVGEQCPGYPIGARWAG